MDRLKRARACPRWSRRRRGHESIPDASTGSGRQAVLYVVQIVHVDMAVGAAPAPNAIPACFVTIIAYARSAVTANQSSSARTEFTAEPAAPAGRFSPANTGGAAQTVRRARLRFYAATASQGRLVPFVRPGSFADMAKGVRIARSVEQSTSAITASTSTNALYARLSYCAHMALGASIASNAVRQEFASMV